MNKITPHKDGRTERLYSRATPEDKALLEALSSEHGVTMSDVIAVSVQAFKAEFNVIERHLLIHRVQSSDYQSDDQSSYTIIIFGDNSKLEEWRDGANVRYSASRQWSDGEIKDFFSGMLFEAWLNKGLIFDEK